MILIMISYTKFCAIGCHWTPCDIKKKYHMWYRVQYWFFISCDINERMIIDFPIISKSISYLWYHRYDSGYDIIVKTMIKVSDAFFRYMAKLNASLNAHNPHKIDTSSFFFLSLWIMNPGIYDDLESITPEGPDQIRPIIWILTA